MISLFPTNIVCVNNCNLDLERLEQKCRNHQLIEPSLQVSNHGGYQGHAFNDDELNLLIKGNIPQLEHKPIESYQCKSWVNINGPGSYNGRHSHDPHEGTFLSGVFYVKCPEESGNIRFFDPRPHIQTAMDMKYYTDSSNYYWFPPVPNTLMMFPSWLEHDVDINKSTEERISISFNIFNVKFK